MTEKEKLISFIQNQYKARFRVLNNMGDDKKIIAGQFPDIIFMQQEPPPNTNILFTMKIETEGNLLDKVSEWQALGNAPSTFYIVLPKGEKLDEAKKLVSAVGARARFAWYEMESGNVKNVYYE